MLTVNRRTAAACAHETFFDCPAWEQAQFPGDSRIRARHHYLVGNDDRLARKAIHDLAASVTASGLLRSHWPSRFEQVISTYSLQWIGMVFDHYQHNNDVHFIAPLLPTARGIIQWFIDRTRSDGLLASIDEATFIDWAFKAGCPPQDDDGGSSLLTALAAESAQQLAVLEEAAGWSELAPRWQQQASIWRQATLLCWDPERGLLRDTLHGQSSIAQATLAGCWEAEQARIFSRPPATPTMWCSTLYYRAHVAEAWRSSGATDRVVALF